MAKKTIINRLKNSLKNAFQIRHETDEKLIGRSIEYRSKNRSKNQLSTNSLENSWQVASEIDQSSVKKSNKIGQKTIKKIGFKADLKFVTKITRNQSKKIDKKLI